jgi:predicted glycosyltransferase
LINRLKILVCSLSWGIGHSSRMIPLIHALLRTGSEVMLASEGKAGELLNSEFPDLPFYVLPSASVRYSRKRSQTLILVLQIPRLLALIGREHRWLNTFIAAHPVDIVISDNCYGLFSRKILSVFVSHQLSPMLPAGFVWMEPLVHGVLGLFIRSFDRCWIPDERDPSQNLTGRLSHRYRVSGNTRFMGILSRFCEVHNNSGEINGKKYDILVILSGPEPQRTLLEEILARQLEQTNYQAAIVCGMQPPVRNKKDSVSHATIDYYYHLPANVLRETMQKAGIIICRSGYSTIMDLAELNLSAILIPTPGQPEQEYLATYLSRRRYFFSRSQHMFDLQEAIGQYRMQNKMLPVVFRTDTENYLKDLITLYKQKKIRHRKPCQKTGHNL